jgi:Ca2+-binding EF-hand superfamily protein
MKKALFAGVAAAAFVAIAPAFAQTPPAAPAPVAAPAPPHAPMMREHTRDEVVAKVREHFARMDTNRDGFVTKAETDALRAQFKAKFAAGRAERIEHRQERMAMNREHMFERLDTNNDGSISRAEFDAAHAARTAMRDRNGDGMPDARRMAGAMGKMHRRMGQLGGQMFEMADANKDGRVSLQEAQDAALRRFDTADANRDGRITREEMMQRHQQMRAQRHTG